MRKNLFLWTMALCSAAVFVFAAAVAAIVRPAPPAATVEKALLLRWLPLREPGSGGAMTALSASPHDAKRLLVAGDRLGVGLSTDGGDSWQATFGFYSWEIADFTWHPTDPNVVWVGTMSGPYVSRDGGRNWREKRAGMPPVSDSGYTAPIEKILFDPRDPAHLLAFGGSSRRWESPGKPLWGVVWESANGGDFWRRRTTITADGSSAALDAAGVNITQAEYAPGGNQVLYAEADSAGFLVSADGGKIWQPRTVGLPPANLGRFALHPQDGKIIYIGMDNYLPPEANTRVPGGVYKTEDGGLSWQSVSDGLGQVTVGNDPNLTARYFAVALAPTDPNILYANDAAWNAGVIYKSTDAGKNWLPLAGKAEIPTAFPAALSLTRLTVDPQNPNLTYGFNAEFIVRTRDGGKTWDDATARFVGDGWRGRGYSGLVGLNIAFDPFQPGRLIVQAMDAGQVWITQNNGAGWTYFHTPETAWNGGTGAAFTRDGHVYALVGPYGWMGIGRSDDGGKTWEWMAGKKYNLPEPEWGQNVTGSIYALPDDAQTVWAVIGAKLYSTENGGKFWRVVLNKPGLSQIAADPKRPERFFVSGAQSVYATNDAGATFFPIGGPRNNGRITVDGKGRLWLAAHQGEQPGVWRRENGVWTRLLDERWTQAVAVDPTDSRRVAITTSSDPNQDHSRATGVWVSQDDGKTWSRQNAGLPMLRANCIAFDPYDPERLVLGTAGRGFFGTRWPRTQYPSP